MLRGRLKAEGRVHKGSISGQERGAGSMGRPLLRIYDGLKGRVTAVHDVELAPYRLSLHWRHSRISRRLCCSGTGLVGVLV